MLFGCEHLDRHVQHHVHFGVMEVSCPLPCLCLSRVRRELCCALYYIHQVNSKEHMKEYHRLYKARVVEQAIQLLADGSSGMESITTRAWPTQSVIRTLEIYESI